MARILGVSWQHSHQTEHIRQGWAAVRGQERGQRSAMPQCLGRFQNPVLCCHSLITGSPQRSASMSTSSPRRTPSMLRRPRPGHPPVRSNLRSRLRRPGPAMSSSTPQCPASSFAGSSTSPTLPHVLSFVPRSVPRAAGVVVPQRRLSVYLRAPRNGARGAVTARVALV